MHIVECIVNSVQSEVYTMHCRLYTTALQYKAIFSTFQCLIPIYLNNQPPTLNHQDITLSIKRKLAFLFQELTYAAQITVKFHCI